MSTNVYRFQLKIHGHILKS